GVSCQRCGSTWSNVGLAYPAIDLSVLPNEKRYQSAKPVSLEDFDELQRAILSLMPDNSLPPPGTRFGPLVGVARGIFGDFAWLNLWTMLVRSQALERLHVAGVRTPIGVAPMLAFKNRQSPDLLELQIEPHAKLASSSFSVLLLATCPSCGRDPNSLPEHLVIEASSVPKHVDLFRARDFTTLILATEEFAEAVQNLKLTGVIFQEVAVE
ncbi:MAG: SitI6 family double-CXXCG motif immunity protein, partial [Pyrinomonadaceae bacterium]